MYKFIHLILFTLLFSCAGQLTQSFRELASDGRPIDIIFDLDWTLISQTRDMKQVELNPSRFITFDDETYRVADWAEDIITDLSRDPRVRISFFSGGGVERNHTVLKKMQLSDGSGRSFFDIAHKVLSRPDLTSYVDQVGENARFSERYKKDIRKVSKDLERVVLVDDNHFFALDESYRRNFLWLGPTFNHYETESELNKARKALSMDDPYVPRKPGQWQLNRNKLLVVWGALREGIDDDTYARRSFVDSIERKVRLLDLAGGEANSNIRAYLKAQERKMKLMRKIRSSQTSQESCVGSALSLFYQF